VEESGEKLRRGDPLAASRNSPGPAML